MLYWDRTNSPCCIVWIIATILTYAGQISDQQANEILPGN